MRILLILVAMSLAGCHTPSISQFAPMDQAERTITVPPGSSLLLGPIKDALAQSGWTMSVDRGPDVFKGAEKASPAGGTPYATRYRLMEKQSQSDVCFIPIGNELVAYDVSVVDNKTGQEILTQSGKGCVDQVAKGFVRVLNAK
jgi:hypothetical protein